MTDESGLIGAIGLQFFGRMCASMSHELKNALAIIKENAGLLSDYIHLTGEGVSVDPERFEKIARRIDTQTRRADVIIKNLNQFAHSVDTPVKSVDLNQILDLLVALHHRPAAMQQVALEPRPAASAVVVDTRPFLLLNVLGLVLARALKTVPAGATLAIAIGLHKGEAEIAFGGLHDPESLQTDGFPGEQENALLTALSAKAIIEAKAGRIVVRLPVQP
jgi:C4-dicarboxylate-specific signal transduction histidine kinase